MIDVLMTVNQYAEHIGIHRDTVMRWVRGKKIKALRSPNGRHWYILTQAKPPLIDVLTK